MPFPFHNEQIVGTCGACSGPMVLPIAWWGVIPPVPTCKECGATARQDYGPVMPVDPPAKWSTSIEIDPDSHKRVGIQIDPDTLGGLRISNGTEYCVR